MPTHDTCTHRRADINKSLRLYRRQSTMPHCDHFPTHLEPPAQPKVCSGRGVRKAVNAPSRRNTRSRPKCQARQGVLLLTRMWPRRAAQPVPSARPPPSPPQPSGLNQIPGTGGTGYRLYSTCSSPPRPRAYSPLTGLGLARTAKLVPSVSARDRILLCMSAIGARRAIILPFAIASERAMVRQVRPSSHEASEGLRWRPQSQISRFRTREPMCEVNGPARAVNGRVGEIGWAKLLSAAPIDSLISSREAVDHAWWAICARWSR